MSHHAQPMPQPAAERQRIRLLLQISRVSEGPMTVLGVVWLVLLIVELTQGLDPVLERIGIGIWPSSSSTF